MIPLAALFILNALAGPASFAGYVKKDATAEAKFEDVVVRLEKSERDFQIAFDRTAPYYRFPRTANERMVERFLREAERLRTKLKVEFNPYTSEIYRISSGR